MEKSCFKKTVIRKFCSLSLTKQLKANKITVVTPAGIISGKVAIDYNDEKDLTVDNLIFKYSYEFISEYRKDHGFKESESLPGNDGFICLSDVSIITGNQTTKLPSLIVFFDQIIAVTISDIQ
jgi:hypothetical protein|nr:MAG TPA: hypothetical protein [Caudoviricetes sp.]